MYIVLFCRLGTFQHVFKRFIDFYGYRRKKKKKNLLSFFPSDPTHPFSNFFRITIISATFFYLLRVVVVVVYNNNTKLFCYWFFVKPSSPLIGFSRHRTKIRDSSNTRYRPVRDRYVNYFQGEDDEILRFLSFNEILNGSKRRKRQYRQ